MMREQFLRHAQRFGCDQVLETATEYLVGSELARLKVELRKIAKSHQATRKSRPPEASTWYETVSALTDADLVALNADPDPMTPSEVALFAGVPVRRVHRALEREAEATQIDKSATELSDVA